MGGMIARYALAYMEHKNMPHNCKLFVSFDAPHLGANIPIGDQLFLSFAANTLEDPFAKEQFDADLNNPAAKQLLIVHHSGFSSSNSNINQGAPNFRERFKQAMTTIGWPLQTRNIAIANGSINGITTGSAGMSVLEFEYNFSSDFWNFFLGRRGLVSKINFTNGYGNSSEIFFYYRRESFGYTSVRGTSATFNSVCSIDAAPGGYYDTQNK